MLSVTEQGSFPSAREIILDKLSRASYTYRPRYLSIVNQISQLMMFAEFRVLHLLRDTFLRKSSSDKPLVSQRV